MFMSVNRKSVCSDSATTSWTRTYRQGRCPKCGNVHNLMQKLTMYAYIPVKTIVFSRPSPYNLVPPKSHTKTNPSHCTWVKATFEHSSKMNYTSFNGEL